MSVMTMADLLTVDRVILRLRARDKRAALHKLASLAHRQVGLSERTVRDAVMRCAELPSFGGDGVALLHAFVPQVGKTIGFFAKAESPLEFDAADGCSVDLLLLLLGPTESSSDHLRALACVARQLRKHGVRERLRACQDRDALYVVLVGEDDAEDAANATARASEAH